MTERFQVNKKGMSLVELIVSIAITVLVIAAGSAALYFGMNSFSSGTEDLSNHQNANLADEYLHRVFSTAKEVTVENVKPQNQANFVLIYFDDEKMLVIEESGKPQKISGIEKIELKTESVGKKMKLNYAIYSKEKNQSFQLNSGVILNNVRQIAFSSKIIQNSDTGVYLNVLKP